MAQGPLHFRCINLSGRVALSGRRNVRALVGSVDAPGASLRSTVASHCRPN